MFIAWNSAILRRYVSTSRILRLLRFPAVDLIVRNRGHGSILAILATAPHQTATEAEDNKSQENGSDHGTNNGNDESLVV